MTLARSFVALVIASALLAGVTASPAAGAEGQATWAVHISLAPTWFDPAETAGIITPFMVLYALHDALVTKIQQLVHEKAMFGPVIEPAFLNGVGPGLEVHGLGLIANHAYSAPYEDLRLIRP
jgi:hypothetical protein